MNTLYSRIAQAAAIVAVAASASPAMAGGIFGKRGVIRGWVGKQLDPIEHEVTTPIARGAAVLGGSIAGGAAATWAGLPPQLGQAAGACAGENINSRFAGRGNVNCLRPILENEVRSRLPLGNVCYTQAGAFGPGPVNPIGSRCTANTQWGPVPGVVGQ